MTQFTASEVRDAITWKYGDKLTRISAMLTAFADLLEAREKAVPVATVVDQFGFPLMEWIGDAGDRCPVGTKLYTHPAPSDAERLAEALQPFANLLQPHHASMPDDRPIYGINKAEITAGDLRRANEALTAHSAHSAQAQPPAASVPEVSGITWEPPNVTVDVERVGRFRSGDEHIVRVTFRSSDDGRRMTCFYAANESAVGYLHAMLAAQENPNG